MRTVKILPTRFIRALSYRDPAERRHMGRDLLWRAFPPAFRYQDILLV
jgi:hypothetical protein